jgi:hypothetical protein
VIVTPHTHFASQPRGSEHDNHDDDDDGCNSAYNVYAALRSLLSAGRDESAGIGI